MSGRRARVSRLLADLRRGETRGDAVRRVRRRAASEIRRLTGRPTTTPHQRSGKSKAGGGRRADSWYVAQWSRLAAAVLGTPLAARDEIIDSAHAPEALTAAARHRSQAVLAEAIGRGEPLEQAVVRSISAQFDALERLAAWSLAEGVARLPGGANASALGHAVIHHRRHQLDRVWSVIRELDPTLLARFIPVEAVDGALGSGAPEGRAKALEIGVPDASMDPSVLVDLAGRFLAVGEPDRAAELVAELRGRSSVELDARRGHSLTLIEQWLAPSSTTVPAGAVPIGILGYRTPDHVLTSGNLGDHIQTLAMLGNLVRLSDVTFTGEDGLGELAGELQPRVRPDIRRRGQPAAAHLVPVDRDFSSARDVPEGTWMVAFGWHMHSLYDLRHDFPYHPHLNPLFLSFHVNRLEMLDEAALAYLRAHGPIGCRDWSTVFLLLGAGVDAFFTGCLTTTVDALFPARQEAYPGNGAVGVIDLPASAAGKGVSGVRTFSHQSDDYRSMTAAEGLRAATTALAAYQRDLDRAITGRLHAYLPLTSLGVPVEFRTPSPGDIRFAGLAGMQPGDPRLDEMRAGIRELTATMFEAILAGTPRDQVYELWRERAAPAVAEARARFAQPVADEPTTIDIAGAVATSTVGSRRFGPHESVDRDAVTDVVLAFDQNLTTPAAVLVQSMVDNASGPLRLWVLIRGVSDAYQEWLAAAFPSLPITFVPCDRIRYGGPDGRPRRVTARITISTMDRLILPDLLTDVRRVVYLDVDTLVIGDVCELGRMDLGGRPVGARDSNVSEASEWLRAGRRLEEPLALELRRRMAYEHGSGHPALNAGVLVMDLDRMRRDDFARIYLGWVERYGFHDQDTMLAYVGPERARVDPRWNALPVIEDVTDPRLIHWASVGKPWEPGLAFEQARWHEVAARLRARAGTEPVAPTA